MIDLGTDEFVDLVEIGRGGFGVVYTARQPAFERTVAIKVLTLDDERTLRRFDRERQALGKVSNHPHITPVFASGFTAENKPYLAMEFMHGGSLADRVEREGALPWPEVLDLGIKMAGALETAHRAGILHRDLKPANILLSDFGEPRLADFGIASLDDGEQTKTGVITASVAYAAPEVLDGKRPGIPADVYGLGGTLFTLVAGAPPFAASEEESILAMVLRVARDPVPDLRGRGVPARFARVLETAMAKTVQERYQTAEAFGNALREAQRELELPPTTMVLPRAAEDGDASVRSDTVILGPPEMSGEHAGPLLAFPPGAPPPPEPPSAEQPTPAATLPSPEQAQTAPAAGSAVAASPGSTAAPPPPGSAVGERSASSRRRTPLLVVAVIVVLAVVAVGGALALQTGDEDPEETAAALPTSTPTADAAEGGSQDQVEDPDQDQEPDEDPDPDVDQDQGAVASGDWQSARPMQVARQQIPAVTLQGTIWVAGGLTHDGVTTSVEGYEPATNSWRTGPDLPIPLHHHMSAVYADELVVLGGWSPEGSLVSAVTSDRVMALRGAEWVDLPPLLQPRVAGAAVGVGDFLVVTGGQDRDGQLLTTTEVFDGTAWREVAGMPTPREHMAATTDGTYLYAVGGRELSADANVAAFERYDPVADEWEVLPDMPTARGGLAAAYADGLLIAIGGEEPLGALSVVEGFDVASGTWSSWPDLPTARHGLGASVSAGALFTLGGALEATHSGPTADVEAVGLG